MSTYLGEASALVRAPHLADWALSRGLVSVTTAQAAELLGVPPDQVRARLHAPMGRGEWVAPARGLWVPVPPQYRAWGAPPVLEYIAALMRHLGTAYYVGWLEAAAIHGVSHQAVQVTQVAVTKPVAARAVGRGRIEFHTRSNLALVPTSPHRTYSGDVPVSTPEATALDVAADTRAGGGLDNAASVIVGMMEETGLREGALAAIAGLFPAAAVRRVGWIMERHGGVGPLTVLRGMARERSATASKLAPFKPGRVNLDRDWNLYINTELDIET